MEGSLYQILIRHIYFLGKMKMKMTRLLQFLAIITALSACSTTKHSEQSSPKTRSSEAVSTEPYMPLTTLTYEKVKMKKIQYNKLITLDVSDYLEKTDFRNHKETKVTFSRAFQRKFLTREPIYKETFQETSDRLIVTRELTLHTKNPCDPGIEKEFTSLCIQKKDGRIHKRIKKGLSNIRNKVKKGIKMSSSDSEKWEPILGMSDDELLDYLYNKQDKEKTITKTSYIPYIMYSLDELQHQDLSNLSKPLIPAKTTKPDSQIIGTYLPLNTPPLAIAPWANRDASPSAPPPPPDEPLEFERERHLSFSKKYVFGETLGFEHTDKHRTRFAKETYFTDEYYFELNYSISFGLGLRFPITIDYDSNITKVTDRRGRTVNYPTTSLCREVESRNRAEECAKKARVSIKANEVHKGQSTETFYREAGVPTRKLFSGKEFVLEFGASCSIKSSTPGPNFPTYHCPTSLRSLIDKSQDFPSQLGTERENFFIHEFNGLDLGLALDAVIGWAALNPGIAVQGDNGKITGRISPTNNSSGLAPNANITRTVLNLSGGTSAYNATENVRQTYREQWGSTVDNLKYKVDFLLAPSISLSFGLDLGVYEYDRKIGPYTIDQFAIDLGGYTFDTHQGVASSQRIISGKRDNNFTPKDPNLFRVTSNGQDADRSFLVKHDESCKIYRLDFRTPEFDSLNIGDIVRITHRELLAPNRITSANFENIGTGENISGQITNLTCRTGRVKIETRCNEQCRVETTTAQCQPLTTQDFVEVSGEVSWSAQNGSNLGECTVQDATVTTNN